MKTVLFICVHNAARSQMAEAFFNEMTGGRHVGMSVGSQPAERVNPKAVEAMSELGIDISGAWPKKLTAEMVEVANLVITMGCGEDVCPIVPKEVLVWKLEDPSGKQLEVVREIRDEIKVRIENLIKALDKSE
jgi:arsenate reductase